MGTFNDWVGSRWPLIDMGGGIYVVTVPHEQTVEARRYLDKYSHIGTIFQDRAYMVFFAPPPVHDDFVDWMDGKAQVVIHDNGHYDLVVQGRPLEILAVVEHAEAYPYAEVVVEEHTIITGGCATIGVQLCNL